MTSEELLAITAGNTSFSRQTPGLQLAIDSTSLGAFKTCPRYYELSILRGVSPKGERVHLTFGLHLHRARETYDHRKAQGASHEQALRAALLEALTRTWDKALGRPWNSGHAEKNRLSLVRTVVWYLDQFGDNDAIRTLLLANGKPAVELSFRFPLPYQTRKGESFLGCGHLDRLGEFAGAPYVVDIKTTRSMLNPKFFEQFSPSNQFSMYKTAGRVAFGTEVKGLIVDGVQVGATFARFQRAPIPSAPGTLDEWMEELGWWTKLMEACAVAGRWPQNDKACDKYGGCEMRGICTRSPGSREQWIKADFTQRVWDPLQVRGDV